MIPRGRICIVTLTSSSRFVCCCWADAVYVFNATMYMLSTLRDYGWGEVLAAYTAPEPFLAAEALPEEKMPLKVGGTGGSAVGGARARVQGAQDGGRDRAAVAAAGYEVYDGYDRGSGGNTNTNATTNGSGSGRSSSTRSAGSAGSGRSSGGRSSGGSGSGARLAPI